MTPIVRCGRCRSVVEFPTDLLGRVIARCPTCKTAPPPVSAAPLEEPHGPAPFPVIAIADVAAYVRRWRIYTGLTLEKAANVLHLTQSTVSVMERGGAYPTYDTCCKLEKALRITITRAASGNFRRQPTEHAP